MSLVVEETVSLEPRDLKLKKLLRSEMKGVDNRLQSLPEVGSEARVVEGGKRAVEMQGELCFWTGQNHGTLFTRLLETETGV